MGWRTSSLCLYLASVYPISSQTTVPVQRPQAITIAPSPAPQEFSVPQSYESFFQELIRLKSFSNRPNNTVQLNGTVRTSPTGTKPSLSIPKLRDLIGVTDSEVAILDSTATDCLSQIKPFLTAGKMTFESRLQEIESGQVSDDLAQRIQDLDRKHEEVVFKHAEALKIAFANSRFQVLDEYVRSSKWTKALVPSAKPIPQ